MICAVLGGQNRMSRAFQVKLALGADGGWKNVGAILSIHAAASLDDLIKEISAQLVALGHLSTGTIIELQVPLPAFFD